MAQQNDLLHTADKAVFPKDSQAMAAILKEMGVEDYEPRVLNQMLEFSYRYVSNVIDDALLYSAHAKKKSIDADDVSLAISLLDERCFTQAPSREVTAEIARQRNSSPLTLIKPSTGLRLPADRYCLTACNYKLKTSSSKKQKIVHTISRVNVSNLSQNSVIKGSPSITSLTKSASIAPLTTKLAMPSTPITARQLTNDTKPVMTPIIKYTDVSRMISSTSASPLTTAVTSSTPVTAPSIAAVHLPSIGLVNLPSIGAVTLPTIGSVNLPNLGAANTDIKRDVLPQKRIHEDDDYDME